MYVPLDSHQYYRNWFHNSIAEQLYKIFSTSTDIDVSNFVTEQLII